MFCSKKFGIIICLISLYAGWLCAQDMLRVRENIYSLCAPGMHGRGAAMDGDSLAGDYLQKQFQKFGLQKFDNSYYQPFRYDINTFPGRVALKVGSKKLEPGMDFILHPASSGGRRKLRVLPLDTNIFTNQMVLQRFFLQQMGNKALLIPKGFAGKLDGLPEEYQTAIHHSAALINMGAAKLTASLAMQQESQPHFQIREGAIKRIKKIKYAVDALIMHQHTSRNVIGFVKGMVDSCIVISAHYDHLGHMGSNRYFPGANDNASGVSMLLELVAYYSQQQNKPKYNIVFMAFAAEEAGLVGSRYYTMHPLFPLPQIKFMINLDLMGTGDDGMMVVNGAVHEKEFAVLQAINEKEKYLPAVKKRGKAANSDHYFFSEKGVPAFFFYTLGGIAAYHDVYDRPETLPLTKYKEVFRLIQDFVNTF